MLRRLLLGKYYLRGLYGVPIRLSRGTCTRYFRATGSFTRYLCATETSTGNLSATEPSSGYPCAMPGSCTHMLRWEVVPVCYRGLYGT